MSASSTCSGIRRPRPRPTMRARRSTRSNRSPIRSKARPIHAPLPIRLVPAIHNSRCSEVPEARRDRRRRRTCPTRRAPILPRTNLTFRLRHNRPTARLATPRAPRLSPLPRRSRRPRRRTQIWRPTPTPIRNNRCSIFSAAQPNRRNRPCRSHRVPTLPPVSLTPRRRANRPTGLRRQHPPQGLRRPPPLRRQPIITCPDIQASRSLTFSVSRCVFPASAPQLIVRTKMMPADGPDISRKSLSVSRNGWGTRIRT